MPRKKTGRTGKVLHTYAPLVVADQVEELIKTRAITESQLLNRALEIALPILAIELQYATPEELALFEEKRAKRTYKHKRQPLTKRSTKKQ